MALSQKLLIRQSQALVMTPQLMQAIKLLQLSNLDLSAYVENELERNPLLERSSEGDEPRADEGGAGAEAAAGESASEAQSSDWLGEELYPGPGVTSREDVRNYVRDTAITYHHQAGTCRMGADEQAVVDPQLRVRGVEGLRVADASVMPTVTAGNTHAPATMIGERAADLVLR